MNVRFQPVLLHFKKEFVSTRVCKFFMTSERRAPLRTRRSPAHTSRGVRASAPAPTISRRYKTQGFNLGLLLGLACAPCSPRCSATRGSPGQVFFVGRGSSFSFAGGLDALVGKTPPGLYLCASSRIRKVNQPVIDHRVDDNCINEPYAVSPCKTKALCR